MYPCIKVVKGDSKIIYSEPPECEIMRYTEEFKPREDHFPEIRISVDSRYTMIKTLYNYQDHVLKLLRWVT